MGNFWSEFESLLESKTFMVLPSRTKIKPNELWKLRKGDHIGWHRLYKGIWHHAVVDEIDEKRKRLRIHVYHNQKKGMVHEWVDVEKETDDMFRFDYPKKVTDENGPFDVLKRAAHLLDEGEDYNLVTNNCEHAASFCKTGVKKSMQVRWVVTKALEFICIELLLSLFDRKVTHSTQKQTEKPNASSRHDPKETSSIQKQTEKSNALSRHDRKETSSIQKQTEKSNASSRHDRKETSSIQNQTEKSKDSSQHDRKKTPSKNEQTEELSEVKTLILFEIFNLLYDVCRIYLKKMHGEMSGEDFREQVIQRVTEAVCYVLFRTLGSWVGAYIGTVIPFLGPILGTYVGSWLGSFLGKLGGSYLGYIIAKLVGEFKSSLTSEIESTGFREKMKCIPIT